MKSSIQKSSNIQHHRRSRRAFTLVELLVVVSIMLILAGITLATIDVTMDNERIGMGSRQVQAFIEGARDRAIYAKAPRGVRFIINENLSDISDVNNPKYYCDSMVYIGPPSKFSLGFVTIYKTTAVPTSSDPDHLLGVILQNSVFNRWNTLYQRGLLVDGARIRIFNPTESNWYTIRIVDDESNGFTTTGIKGSIVRNQLKLTRQFSGSSSRNQSYELQLEPTVLPNQEPRQFAKNIVIDVSNSKVPSAWQQKHISYAEAKLDIMYGPNGIVFGTAASSGSIHLLIADTVDTIQGRGPGDPTKEGDERIISITTKTGGTATYAVHFPQTWSADQEYKFGQWVHPVGDTSKYYFCTQAGTAGSSEPGWTTGTTEISDGGAKWLYNTSQDPLYYAETGAGK